MIGKDQAHVSTVIRDFIRRHVLLHKRMRDAAEILLCKRLFVETVEQDIKKCNIIIQDQLAPDSVTSPQ